MGTQPLPVGRRSQVRHYLLRFRYHTHRTSSPTNHRPQTPNRHPLSSRCLLYRESGFSLIELLVVVTILAVLAAIAIPLFLNQKNKAKVGALRSDLHNLVIEAHTLKPETGRWANSGVYGLNPPYVHNVAGYPDYTNIKTLITNSGFKKSFSEFDIYVQPNCKFNGVSGAVGDDTTPFFGNGTADGAFVVRGRTNPNPVGTVTQITYDSTTNAWEEETGYNNGGRWGALSGACGWSVIM